MSWAMAALVALLQLGAGYGPPERCVATTFCHRGDALCGGVAPYYGRRVREDDWGVAQRWRKRGSWVRVCNRRTGLCAAAPVVDAGPWMRTGEDGVRYNAVQEVRERRLRPGRWRGCVDLTVPVARAIGSDGWDPVEVRPLRFSLAVLLGRLAGGAADRPHASMVKED